MADQIKRINVKIGGMVYQLVAAENEAYIRQMAARADEMIRRVMQNNPQLSLNMSTVLALVNAMDELNKSYQQLSLHDQHRLDADRQSGEIRTELMRMREQNWEMKKELLRLNALVKEYETMIDQFTRTVHPVDSADPADSPEPDRPFAANNLTNSANLADSAGRAQP